MSDGKNKDIIDEQIERIERVTKGAENMRRFAERFGISPFMAGVLGSVAGSGEIREAAGFLLAEEVYKKGESLAKALRPTESQDSTAAAPTSSGQCPHGHTIGVNGTSCPECA